MKKVVAILIACVSCVNVMGTAVFATEVVDCEPIVDDATALAIFSEYEEEIRYIEELCNCSISQLTKQNIDLIKYQAALNHKNDNYDFPGMMTEIALACARADAGGSNEANGTSPLNNDNEVSVCSSSEILAGMHLRDVATGATTTRTYSTTFLIEAGSDVLGITVSREFSDDFSYSINGPADGLCLANDVPVTHRTAFAVLYGTIIESGGETYIEPTTAAIVDYSILASIGIPTYCGQARGNGTLYFSDPSQYRQAFVDFPSPFI